jgi:hypothetical protein
MTKEMILFSPITLSELESRIKILLRDALLSKEQEKIQDQLLSAEETRKLFCPPISKVTLYNWTKQGKLKQYRIGYRIFYKYSEIQEALVQLKKYKK